MVSVYKSVTEYNIKYCFFSIQHTVALRCTINGFVYTHVQNKEMTRVTNYEQWMDTLDSAMTRLGGPELDMDPHTNAHPKQ